MRARRAPRAPRDEALEAQRIADRQLEQWIDEGEADDDLRSVAAEAVQRGEGVVGEPRGPRQLTPEERERRQKQAISRVDPELAAEIRAATPDPRVAARTVERVGKTQEALDRDRLDEARRTINPIAKTLPGVAGVQELAGLVAYRLGRWRDAVRALDAAQTLRTNVEMLPVLADAHRALRHWDAVARIWREIKELSPSHEVMAEGRIVAAGALADQGDLTAALAEMAAASTRIRRVEDYHLRQWYVLGDLHDRAGNPIEAARWFERIAAVDDDYYDVPERLGALGRRRR